MNPRGAGCKPILINVKCGGLSRTGQTAGGFDATLKQASPAIFPNFPFIPSDFSPYRPLWFGTGVGVVFMLHLLSNRLQFDNRAAIETGSLRLSLYRGQSLDLCTGLKKKELRSLWRYILFHITVSGCR